MGAVEQLWLSRCTNKRTTSQSSLA